MTTLADTVRAVAAVTPNRVALVVDGTAQRRTYGELDRRACQLANGLLAAGLRPGDHVAAWLDDSIEYVELYIAAACAGLVVSPVNAMFTAEEAAFQIEDVAASALFVSDRLVGEVPKLDLDGVRLLVNVGDERCEGAVGLGALIAGASAQRPTAPEPSATFVIGYTSGTTGQPKGAMLSHEAVMAAVRTTALLCRLPLYGTMTYAASMSFVATVTCFLFTHLYTRATVVFVPDRSAAGLIAATERHRATFTYVATRC